MENLVFRGWFFADFEEKMTLRINLLIFIRNLVHILKLLYLTMHSQIFISFSKMLTNSRS